MSLNLRAIENWSKIKKENKFFLDVFNTEDIKENLLIYSSKALELIKNIKKLDEQDLKNEGKLFKHYIFTDEPRHGGLMLASTMLSFGYNLCYNFMTSNKITLKSNDELRQTEKENFALITSSSLGKDKKMKLQEVKTILNKFNQRPENVNGDLIRIVILDKGFKEGIDLYDVKYAHIYEIPTSKTDQKQSIGRATRNCGQAGLDFIKNKGWVLDTYIYSSLLDDKRLFDIYMESKKNASAEIDIKIIDLFEKMSLIGSVDYDLNYNIHKKKEKDLLIESLDLGELVGGSVQFKKPDCAITCGVPNFPIVTNKMDFVTMKNFVKQHYGKFKWDPIIIKDNCNVKRATGDLQFNNTQNFIRNFFHVDNYYRGMLLAHSIGSGKTCSAISLASSSYQQKGYTILWVTRTSLKADMLKNMISNDKSCNAIIKHVKKTEDRDLTVQEMKELMKQNGWEFDAMSYKQFTNLVSGKNKQYKILKEKNGSNDILKKTLIIIDEAHKLYGGFDLKPTEKPDMEKFYNMIQNSYEKSGSDSTRLLLMTATPIVKDPMEFMKLLNTVFIKELLKLFLISTVYEPRKLKKTKIANMFEIVMPVKANKVLFLLNLGSK